MPCPVLELNQPDTMYLVERAYTNGETPWRAPIGDWEFFKFDDALKAAAGLKQDDTRNVFRYRVVKRTYLLMLEL